MLEGGFSSTQGPESGPEVHVLSDGDIEENRVDQEILSPDEARAKKARSGENQNIKWMADSGANCHVCRERDSFISYKQYASPRVTTGATSGSEVHACGVGTVCIKLAVEKLQEIRIDGKRNKKPSPTDQFIYIMLRGVIYSPAMSRNYLDTTALRKTEGGVITIVGDNKSNRIIAGHTELQYTMEEADGQELSGHFCPLKSTVASRGSRYIP